MESRGLVEKFVYNPQSTDWTSQAETAFSVCLTAELQQVRIKFRVQNSIGSYCQNTNCRMKPVSKMDGVLDLG